MQDLPFGTLTPKIYRDHYFHCTLFITTIFLKSKFQRSTFHVQAPAYTLFTGCYDTYSPPHSIQKNRNVFYDMYPNFWTLAGSKGRIFCWIIAGSSLFGCSRRPHGTEMHQVTIIFCKPWCSLLQNSSKNSVRSVVSAQTDIIAP